MLSFNELIAKADLTDDSFRRNSESGIFPLDDRALMDYSTHYPLFAFDLREAFSSIRNHFKRMGEHPLNCLVLGPPGSGKSTIVKYLRKSIAKIAKELTPGEKEPVGIALSYNLSMMSSVHDLDRMYKEIERLNYQHDRKPGTVFIDEFDVRLNSQSAVQSMISPMYDPKEFSNIVFIYSGSNFVDKDDLAFASPGGGIQNALSLYADLLLGAPSEIDKNRLSRDLHNVVLTHGGIAVDRMPGRKHYISGLEKITDFISRINGFILELPKLDSPLDVTAQRFVFEPKNGQVLTPHRDWEQKLIPFATADSFFDENWSRFNKLDPKTFDNPFRRRLSIRPTHKPGYYTYLLQNSILIERFWRVVRLLRNLIERRRDKNTTDTINTFSISRCQMLYLSTVPVLHGMRSVESIVENLECEKDPAGIVDVELHLPDQLPGTVRSHIRRDENFNSPEFLWSKVSVSNNFDKGCDPHGKMIIPAKALSVN